MFHHLDRGSSPGDWWEENYTFTPLIAKFFITVSNFIFLVMPPFLMVLHRPYSDYMGPENGPMGEKTLSFSQLLMLGRVLSFTAW